MQRGLREAVGDCSLRRTAIPPPRSSAPPLCKGRLGRRNPNGRSKPLPYSGEHPAASKRISLKRRMRCECAVAITISNASLRNSLRHATRATSLRREANESLLPQNHQEGGMVGDGASTSRVYLSSSRRPRSTKATALAVPEKETRGTALAVDE